MRVEEGRQERRGGKGRNIREEEGEELDKVKGGNCDKRLR